MRGGDRTRDGRDGGGPAGGARRRAREEDPMSPTPPLTALSEEEQIFQQTIRDFAEREIAPRVREDGPAGPLRSRDRADAVRARRDGDRDARGAGGRGRELLPERTGGRGALARRRRGRSAGRRAEHPGDECRAALRERGVAEARAAQDGGAGPWARTHSPRRPREATRSLCRRAPSRTAITSC